MKLFYSLLVAVFLLTFCLADVSEALKTHKKHTNNVHDSIPAFKTFYITQKIDHFNFRDDRTFQQRYLLNGKLLVKLNSNKKF